MSETIEQRAKVLYYLLSGIQLDFDAFDLGQGVTLSRTYVHLMSHPILAFERAEGRQPHPGPWQAVQASSPMTSIDLYAILSVPEPDGGVKVAHQWANWIALLLRFSSATTVTITLSANGDPTKLRSGEAQAKLLEPIPRLQEGTTISPDSAAWLRDNWHSSLHLSSDEDLMFALTAIHHSHESAEALGLVSVWAALERLFSSNAAELKFRVCANIAAFLEAPGEDRYVTFKYLTKLYDARSAAAHGSEIKRADAYMDSVSIASQVVLRIIELGKVPSKEELEKELLSPSAPR